MLFICVFEIIVRGALERERKIGVGWGRVVWCGNVNCRRWNLEEDAGESSWRMEIMQCVSKCTPCFIELLLIGATESHFCL